MSIQTRNTRRRITQCSDFDELQELLNPVPQIMVYFNEINEKLQSLPISINDELIWILLRHAYVKDAINMTSIMTLLVSYCNRIITEGLLDSNTSAENHADVIPVIILVSTVDKSSVDIKYLAEAASAITGYNYDYTTFLRTDSELNLKQLFNKNINTALERVVGHREGFLSGTSMDIINTLSNDDCRKDILIELMENHFHYNGEYMINKSAEYLYACYQNGANRNNIELDKSDFYYWITYFMATIERICKETPTCITLPIGIRNKIIKEWVLSSEIVNSQFPEIEPIELKYSLMNLCQVHARMYAEDLMPGFFPSLANVLNIITNITWDSKGVLQGIPSSLVESQFNPVTEAKSINDQKHNTADADEDSEPEEDEDPYDDKDIRRRNRDPKAKQTKGGYDKSSSAMDKASRKIYKGYRAYKDAESKVDSQVSKLTLAIKNKYRKGVRDEIVEGKDFSVVRILKKVLTTAAIFSYSKIAGILYLIVKRFTHNKVSNKERREMMQELQLEIKMLDEKIEDARGDNNRQAKYSMMRTRAELQKAYDQIRYGIKANRGALGTARDVIRGKKSLKYNGPDDGGEE